MEHYKNYSLQNILMEFEGIIYEEEWKQIDGYEFLYDISSFGRVKSLAKTWTSGKGLIKEKEDSILVQSDSKKYKKITLKREGKKAYFLTHRLVGSYFLDNPDNLPDINHLDGIKANNFYKNLEWSTKSNNIVHALKTGLKISLKGEAHPSVKLTENDIYEIRKLCIAGMFQKEVAKKFNIRQQTVSRIMTNKRWKHI